MRAAILARIDGWIEFVNSPETGRPYLAIDGFTGKFFRMPVTENSQFAIVDRDFESGLIDAGHLRVDCITLFGGFHIRQRGHVLDRAFTLAGENWRFILLLGRDIHDLLQICLVAEPRPPSLGALLV